MIVLIAALGIGMYMFHAWLEDVEEREDKIGDYCLFIGSFGYIVIVAVAIILYEMFTVIYHYLFS